MAARGLVQLFRAVNPALLRAKDRGRPQPGSDPSGATVAAREFGGHLNAVDYLDGAEVLNPDEAAQKPDRLDKKTPNRKRKAQTSSGSESGSDSDGWVDVDNSGGSLELILL